jgi:hypothetical protein
MASKKRAPECSNTPALIASPSRRCTKCSPAAKQRTEVFAEIDAKKLGNNGAVMFFAHYYGGLNEELLGRRERARELLHKAVESTWGRKAEGGPAYMWQCARLHAERIASAPK